MRIDEKGGIVSALDLQQLALKANDIRTDIIDMISRAGSGHPGGSLSAADILTALYFADVLDYDPSDPNREDRDRFVMAKGHAAPALYATLAHAGFIGRDALATLRKVGSILQGHPDSNLCPGVEVSTGSLGQGLSVAAGMACGLRLNGTSAAVFALLGDGECEEGQVWEAAMFAAHQDLGALVAIIDNNELQIDGCIHDVCDPGDLGKKFAAFGWDVVEVDGHDLAALVKTFTESKQRAAASKGTGAPRVIVAHTVKGKGVSFMENQAGWHGKAPDAEQTKAALDELNAERSRIEGGN